MLRLLLFCCLTTSLFAQATNRDGHWWRKQSNQAKVFYVAGIRDGLGTAAPLIRIVSENVEAEYLASVARVYLKPDVPDFCMGLNEFYSDFRNTNIPVFKAMIVVAMQIGGAKEELIRGQTEQLRSESR